MQDNNWEEVGKAVKIKAELGGAAVFTANHWRRGGDSTAEGTVAGNSQQAGSILVASTKI